VREIDGDVTQKGIGKSGQLFSTRYRGAGRVRAG